MRARRLSYAAAARRDLESIRSYYSRKASPRVAARMIARLRRKIAAAREMPEAGTPRPEYDPACRFVAIRPYVIYYLLSDRVMTIVRILHWAQDRDDIMKG